MVRSAYGRFESQGEEVDVVAYHVAAIHQIHGDACLCGSASPVSRDRTEHIIDETLKALAKKGLLR